MNRKLLVVEVWSEMSMGGLNILQMYIRVKIERKQCYYDSFAPFTKSLIIRLKLRFLKIVHEYSEIRICDLLPCLVQTTCSQGAQ